MVEMGRTDYYPRPVLFVKDLFEFRGLTLILNSFYLELLESKHVIITRVQKKLPIL